MRRRLRVAALCLVPLLAGCGASVAASEAEAAATTFLTAAPDRACALLAPETARSAESEDGGCTGELGRLRRPGEPVVQAVDVAGEGAQVRFADQVVFLARFPEGWRVTAAWCVRADTDVQVPYECAVKP